MPSDRTAPLEIIIRPPGRPPYVLSLERLTEHLQAARLLLMPTRDELKALRLQAMGTVDAQRSANADMYKEVIAYGGKVAEAREAARVAHIAAANAEITDLKEMADEMTEFAQAVPTSAVGGAMPPAATPKPSAGSEALAKLMAAQPGDLKLDTPYDGTHPPGTEGPK